jgi:drug/metabolite transporter, DME family
VVKQRVEVIIKKKCLTIYKSILAPYFSNSLLHLCLEPLTAALLGVFILGEYLSLTSWLGIFLLMLGIAIVIWAPKVLIAKRNIEWFRNQLNCNKAIKV